MRTASPREALESEQRLDERFKSAFRHHPSGAAVVTADSGEGPAGLTATSVISVSASPAIVVFSLSAQSSAAPTIASADTVVVHLLTENHTDVATLFSTSGVDRFADESSWGRLDTGEPALMIDATRLRGRIIRRMTLGGSLVMAVEVLDVELPEGRGNALVYYDRAWHNLAPRSGFPV